jgi:hypothetical protein
VLFRLISWGHLPACRPAYTPCLRSFGELRVLLEIWQTLTRYNVWIEPPLISEWVRLIEG